MIEFNNPVIKKIYEDKKYGKFSVFPLEKGYGITLGNSLRRILLSSISGTAVTNVKIDNIFHEFSVIDGIREDVIQIILNLKMLAVKVFLKKSVLLEIDIIGPCVVKASDIIESSDFEIINKDLIICNIVKKVRFHMNFTVEVGRGYVIAKNHKKSKIIGVLNVDSLFTPVLKVNYFIKNMYIGKRSDFDKLIFEIWTNGILLPYETLSIAAKILIEHLNIFIDLTKNIKNLNIMEKKKENIKEKKLDISIENLDLSVRSYNCLKRSNINTINDLIKKTKFEVMSIKNFGKKSFNEIQEKLLKLKLDFFNKK